MSSSPASPANVADVVLLVPAANAVGPVATGQVNVAASPVPPGTTIKYAGVTLTAVNGAPGADQFQGDAGSVGAIAASIVAGMAAAGSSWLTVATATVVGSLVTLASVATGPQADTSILVSDASLAASGMAGGSALVDFFLSLGLCILDPTCWGDKLCKANALLAAHGLALAGEITGAGGVLNKIKIDKIEKGFAVATPNDPTFGSSSWGQLYLMLAESVFCGPLGGGHLCLVF